MNDGFLAGFDVFLNTEDTTHQEGDGTLARSGQNGQGGDNKKYRFVQLYTSKSYESRRSELVNPPESPENAKNSKNGKVTREFRRSNSTENLSKHVLSPRLVEAISNTTQVVWANTRKQEGLIGRSDICLQTAVGMPVAMDSEGNMCIVVMFSPNNIQSTDDAMEYLQSISMSATSTSIPCLLPVVDPNHSGLKALPPSDHMTPHPDASALGEGVTARFVSLDDHSLSQTSQNDGTIVSANMSDAPEVHSNHELATAPKDTFGIPMLPSFAELDGENGTTEENIDVFDEASYGIWSTIMETLRDDPQATNLSTNSTMHHGALHSDDNDNMAVENRVRPDPALQVRLPNQCSLSDARIERLEEFCGAFLGMSVFDLADVWVPAANDGFPDCLRRVMSVASTETNVLLNEFKAASEHALIKFWTGGVGRAYSSGNPVWSANPNVFVDAGRATAFERANVKTVLAVPVFSGKQALPTCVVSCYSLVRSGSVPFVLRFVQQALRLLWDGLDQFEPHESVGNIWKGIAPADLGEMAADVEMQQHFISKKRPHSVISGPAPSNDDPRTNYLSSQLQTIRLPTGESLDVPLQLPEDVGVAGVSEVRVEMIQSHLQQAVQSVASAVPFDRVNTNEQGTKRAHVMAPINSHGSLGMPLPLPGSLPTHVVSSQSSLNGDNSTSSISPQACRPVSSFSLPSEPQMTSGGYFNAPLTTSSVPQTANIPLVCEPVNVMPAPPPANAKLCRIQGCDIPAAARRPYCERHSGNRLCEHPGCSKCAQGCTRFCIAHGGGRRCTFPGCDKGARDKFFCAAHGGGKRCKHDGCSKSAVGGSSLCTAHGGGRRCSVEGCDKSAQSSTKFCVKHGGGKKCAHEGCEKVARGRTPFCAAHGGGVRCKLEGCNRVAIGKMQLCRAHGGASSRAKKRAVAPQDAAMPQSVLQQEAMLHVSAVPGVHVNRM